MDISSYQEETEINGSSLMKPKVTSKQEQLETHDLTDWLIS